MNTDKKRQLAALLADRVRDKADLDDTVGMFRAASLLDSVNEELGHPEEKEAPAETPPPAGRRVFVQG